MTTVTRARSIVNALALSGQRHTVKASDLPALLCSRPGCQAITIIARTAPDMNKRGNPFYGRVTKLSRVNGMIGWQYASSVNRQREREAGDSAAVPFVAEARKWGQRLEGTPLVEHKGQLYLELKVERVLATEYRLDGAACQREALGDWIKDRSGESSRQGVEREIILRDYKLASIVQVVLGGIAYTVEHDEPAKPDAANNTGEGLPHVLATAA